MIKRTSCLICSPRATYFPLGLNLNDRPIRSLGAPSKPLSLVLAEAIAFEYGFAFTSMGTIGAEGGGVGALRVFALIEANLGCIGL